MDRVQDLILHGPRHVPVITETIHEYPIDSRRHPHVQVRLPINGRAARCTPFRTPVRRIQIAEDPGFVAFMEECDDFDCAGMSRRVLVPQDLR